MTITMTVTYKLIQYQMATDGYVLSVPYDQNGYHLNGYNSTTDPRGILEKIGS